MRPQRTLWWISVLLLTIPTLLKGQDSQYLTLKQAIELSEKNSTSVLKAQIDQRIAKANRQQTDAIFLPQISLGYQAMFTNDPLNAFGFLLQQRQVTSADFDPNKLNQPGNAQNYIAGIEFQMPLLNVDKIYARKGAKLQEEVYNHQTEYTRDYVRFEVQKAYTQLQFAYRAQQVLDSTLHDVQGIYESVNNFHKQGLVHKSDVLNAKVQVNNIESALSKAESNIANASDGLRILLGESLANHEEVYKAVPLHANTYLFGEKQFSTQRPDLLAMQKAVDASHTMEKSAIMAYVPTINAFGNYQFNDDKMFHFKEDSYLLGISMKWKIFSGNSNRGKYRAAKFQHEKMQKDYDLYLNKSRMEVDKNRRAITDLQLEMHKQEMSVAQATEALRIMSDRHREGLVSTTDLLLSQAQLSQQRLALAQTIMNYNIACYYHDFLTHSL